MKKIRCDSFIFEIIIVLISALAIILNFNLFKSFVGIFYYTIFSNALCLIFYSVVLIKKLLKKFKKTSLYYNFKGLTLLSIICTMLIYNFVMVPTGQVGGYNGHFIVSSMAHIVVPLLVIIDFCLNEKKYILKYKYLVTWLLSIIGYGIIVIIYSKLGGHFLDGQEFLYFNFDIKTYGLLSCICMNVIIILIYISLGAMLVAINNKKNKDLN